MAGRPRKPTHLKVVSGTAQKCRTNAAEPKPRASRLAAPSSLSARARRVWVKASKLLNDMGVLTVADGIALEALCLAIADEQEARASLSRPVTYTELEEQADDEGKKHYVSVTREVSGGGDQIYTTVGKSGPMIRMRPEVAAIADANRRVSHWLSKFGLTPADRSRVGAEPAKAANPFENLG